MHLLKLGVILLFLFLSIFSKGLTNIEITKGVLDLRNQDLDKFQEVKFSGEWEFYWNQLLSSNDFDNQQFDTIRYIEVPSVWTNYEIDGQKLPGKGAATYRMNILLNNTNQKMAFKLGSIGTAFKLIVDEIELQHGGKVSLYESNAVAGYNPGVVTFTPKTDTVEVIFQVSNYHYSKGGIWDNFGKLGSASHILKSWNRDVQMSILIIGCILIFAIYHFGLYLLNLNFHYTLYFSLFCIIIVFRTIVVNEIFLLDLFPSFSWTILIKIEYFTLLLGTLSFSLFIYKFFIEEYSLLFLKFIVGGSTFFSLLILITPPAIFTKFLILYQINIVVASLYIVYAVFKALLKKKQSAFILLIGFLVLMIALINDILYTNRIIDTALVTSYGFIFFIFSQSYMLSARFSSLLVKTESLAQSLEITNINLEKMVDERTQKIKEQNVLLYNQSNEIQLKNSELEIQYSSIKGQRDSLQKQNAIVNEQKKEITGSIEYASKIQSVVLAASNEIDTVAPDSFILFKPKDIVSGDFYWFKEIKIGEAKLKMVTVVDCTGHGVPGAFMSILGTVFLNKIVGDLKSIPKAADVLNEMRNEVKTLLRQYTNTSLVKDGMDMALAIIDYKNMEIQYAGANNPLYIIRNEKGNMPNLLDEYKGDNMPIGIYIKEKKSFTNNIIKIKKGDQIYLFSDGYYDQFGGEFGKKFMKKTFKNLLLQNSHLNLNEQKQMLEIALKKWQGNYEQIDDITVVGIKV
ncbi:MAG: SpoIIE family protein phosphatase [Salinivirgaceae bacterium]|jgi:serine phosphatase RsbU (regulator of sigma subunit)|nr:SpoIIE family protein phosphatase [Salinivirgaceae bacterium]